MTFGNRYKRGSAGPGISFGKGDGFVEKYDEDEGEGMGAAVFDVRFHERTVRIS